jgi:tRNA(Ile)-lysidine synthase
MNEIFQALFHKLESYQELISKHRAILAYSGGKDSKLLLEFYRFLVERKLAPRPIVYHLDHRIRDNRDQEQEILEYTKSIFFADTAFYSRNIPKIATRIRKSLEETGRIIRYHHLTKIQNSHNSYIVTGHHAKDYLESLLIHWIRGGGQKAIETLPIWNGKIFRPLLALEDKELYALYQKVQLDRIWEDESNEDDRYLRNRVRKNIIHFLEKESLNFFRLYKNLQPDPELAEFKILPIPSHLLIPSSTVENIANLRDWKTVLDLHTKILKLHPPARTSLEESFRLIQNRQSFTFHTSEFHLTKQRKGPVYIIPSSSALLHMPQFQREGESLIVHWNQNTIAFPMGNSEDKWTVEPAKPGEKIIIHSINREISEIFREKFIPKIVRPFFPILRKNGVPIRILFSLMDSGIGG